MGVRHGGNLFEVSRSRGWNWREVLDFSASINPLGPAPGVAEAIRAAVDRIAWYPEREPARLREALARAWGVDEYQVLPGNGATELLHFLARTELVERVTLAVPVFSEFHRAYPRAATVPADETKAWPREGLLVLTEPLNPTGQALCRTSLEAYLASTANPVLMDESFLEFTARPSVLPLIARRPNLYVLRSLTKFYALPGLRVGALVASPETVERWRARREPWQVNVLAEEAALAALADRDHAARTLALVAEERDWLFVQLAGLPGVFPAPSHANYLFARLAYPAAKLCAHLLEGRILVRDCTGWPGVAGEAVRVAVRTRAENERLVACWKEFACAAC